MLLFPAEGIMETIFQYGQTFSIFLVLAVFEGVIAAQSKTNKPGLLFLFGVFLLAVGVGVGFKDITFFFFMLIPVALCALAFWLSRKTRKKNIEKGIVYNDQGLIETEIQKMEKGE